MINTIAFIDDITLYTSSGSVDINAQRLRTAYITLATVFRDLGLEIETSKAEVFHFLALMPHPRTKRRSLDRNPRNVNKPIVTPGPIWRYLGFFFDPYLTFDEHVTRYTNKALSTIAALRMIGNSMDGLPPSERRQVFKACSDVWTTPIVPGKKRGRSEK